MEDIKMMEEKLQTKCAMIAAIGKAPMTVSKTIALRRLLSEAEELTISIETKIAY